MTASAAPASLEAFLSVDPLLPGEDRAAYNALHQSMLDDLQPQDDLERIWAQEIIVMTWERMQLARLRTHILTRARRTVLWSILSSGLKSKSVASKRLSALLKRWDQQDPDAVAHVNARLAEKGHDLAGVTMRAHRENLQELDTLTKTAAGIERRRERLLREIARRQEFAARVDAIARQYEVRFSSKGSDERLGRPPSKAEIASTLRAGRH